MQTESLKVSGMRCGSCSRSVVKALKAVAGVSDVSVSLSAGVATVEYDDLLASRGQLKEAVENAGYCSDAASSTARALTRGGCCGC